MEISSNWRQFRFSVRRSGPNRDAVMTAVLFMCHVFNPLSAVKDSRYLVGHFEWRHQAKMWFEITDGQRLSIIEIICKFVVSTVPADGLAALGARPSAGTGMAKFVPYKFTRHVMALTGLICTKRMFCCATLLIPRFQYDYAHVKYCSHQEASDIYVSITDTVFFEWWTVHT